MKPASISRTFITLNIANDFAYFGFLIIQFYLLDNALTKLLPSGLSQQSVSFTIFVIVSQLIWQMCAEGPTGAFADNYGRGRAVAASFFCRFIGIGLILGATYLIGEKMPSFLLAVIGIMILFSQMLFATGEAFLEGSIEAWLRDEMEVASATNFEIEVDRTFGLSAIAQNLTILVSLAVFLGAYQMTNNKETTIWWLACLASITFLAGGLLAGYAAKKEKFIKKESQQNPLPGIFNTIRDAIRSILFSESPEVRRVAIVLVLPFPCWILLSWFFMTFVKHSTGLQGTLPPEMLLWLGLSLGIARVIGAWVGNKMTSQISTNKLSFLFEKSVVLNVLLLFIGGVLLVIVGFIPSHLSLELLAILFILIVAVSKGSEEVVKLSKNRLLAVIVSNAKDRATILSLISICQNAFAFIVFGVAGLLALLVWPNTGQNISFMFCICGVMGLVAAIIMRAGRKKNTSSLLEDDIRTEGI